MRLTEPVLRVGLTGGIGAGKSEVARRLVGHGAVLIDADTLAREAVAPGTDGLREVAEAFGTRVLDPSGTLDRAALAAAVFDDPTARRRLEGIVHPKVAARRAALAAAAPGEAIVVDDIPLLVEVGLAPSYHLVIVVEAAEEIRVARLVRDRGMTETAARARIGAQASDATRRAAADVVLGNDGGREALHAAVDALWRDRLLGYEENLRLGRASPRGAPRPVAYDLTWPAQARRLIARLRWALAGPADRSRSAPAGSPDPEPGSAAPASGPVDPAGGREDPAGGPVEPVTLVDHIGPTAVPGLAAEDVIDLQVTVGSLAEADALAAPLAAAGFPVVPGIHADVPLPAVDPDPAHWRKRVHAGADPGRWADVHLRVAGSPGWRFALLFPAWLRADTAAREEYERLRRRLAREYGGRAPTAPGELPEAAPPAGVSPGSVDPSAGRTFSDAMSPWFVAAAARAEQWAAQTGWRPGDARARPR